MRLCDLCHALDDGPRHVFGYAPGEVPVDLELVAQIAARPGVSVEDRQAALHAAVDMTLHIHHPACGVSAGCEVCTPEEN